MKAWIENELKGCEFPDVRLGKRFKTIIEQLTTGIGRSYTNGFKEPRVTSSGSKEKHSPDQNARRVLSSHARGYRILQFTDHLDLIIITHPASLLLIVRKHYLITRICQSTNGPKRALVRLLVI